MKFWMKQLRHSAKYLLQPLRLLNHRFPSALTQAHKVERPCLCEYLTAPFKLAVKWNDAPENKAVLRIYTFQEKSKHPRIHKNSLIRIYSFFYEPWKKEFSSNIFNFFQHWKALCSILFNDEILFKWQFQWKWSKGWKNCKYCSV